MLDSDPVSVLSILYNAGMSYPSQSVSKLAKFPVLPLSRLPEDGTWVSCATQSKTSLFMSDHQLRIELLAFQSVVRIPNNHTD
jgi:hypothetical protein